VVNFSVSVPHEIGRAEALSRLRKFLEITRHDYAHEVSDVRGQWEGNQLEFTFSARGQPIQGSLVVEENAVHVSGLLEFRAILFRGRIEETIREGLCKLLR
jgi:hypothetical protein